MTATSARPVRPVPGLFAIVGFLVCVELASGVLQGYYTPIYSDIADHLSIKYADVNWFEAAQLVVSALVVPPLARLEPVDVGVLDGQVVGDVAVDRGVVALQHPAGELDADQEADDREEALGLRVREDARR